MWCKRVYGEKCPECGGEAITAPTFVVGTGLECQCANGHVWTLGEGGKSHAICDAPECQRREAE